MPAIAPAIAAAATRITPGRRIRLHRGRFNLWDRGWIRDADGTVPARGCLGGVHGHVRPSPIDSDGGRPLGAIGLGRLIRCRARNSSRAGGRRRTPASARSLVADPLLGSFVTFAEAASSSPGAGASPSGVPGVGVDGELDRDSPRLIALAVTGEGEPQRLAIVLPAPGLDVARPRRWRRPFQRERPPVT